MTPAVEQLVRETMELTGASTPQLLEDDAPVLADEAMELREPGDDDGGDFYLVGIIGGKDVGKSALVNALVGRPITAITSHGPGTETVVAYAHASREPALRALLEREVPGQYRIVTHDSPHLLRQVLLDLPDIDSHWRTHLEVTRAVLRHMLYPVWVQSVEKYADRQPQEMLARVAAGNAASNFVFCLNKVDQVEKSGGDGTVPEAAREIRSDFAARIARTVGLQSPPDVFLISATHPERYDLPRLRGLLSRQKTEDVLRKSKELAVRRQDRSLLAWLREQQLDERAARLERLLREAEEAVAARVGEPLLERAIPRMLEDASARLAMTDEVLRARVARWPLVNLVHTLLSPLLAVWRSNAAPAGPRFGAGGAESMVETYLGACDGAGGGVARLVQTTFAQLRQSQPLVATLYRHNRLWEDMPAELAAGELRRTLAVTVERQRDVALQRLSGRNGVVAPLLRWLLTVGALLWFPFIQPVLEGMLKLPEIRWDWWTQGRNLAGLIVGVLSGESLLRNVTFLIIWFTVIWLALRWGTQRRVARFLARMRSPDERDPSLNLTAQAVQWMEGLLAPLRRSTEQTADLARRAAALEQTNGAAA
jgi:GTPase Era involved in 16S rRNA processing